MANRAAIPIRTKLGTSTFWTAKNPVLLSGEMGVESNTGKIKIGDGSNLWSSLNYMTQLSPLLLPTHTASTVPTASSHTGSIIYVSDETGGATLAFSNGTDWLRVQDLTIISA